MLLILHLKGLRRRAVLNSPVAVSLREMIKEDLIAERIAVEFYSAIIRWPGGFRLTTRRKVIPETLAIEAQHAEDMKVLFESFETDSGSETFVCDILLPVEFKGAPSRFRFFS